MDNPSDYLVYERKNGVKTCTRYQDGASPVVTPVDPETFPFGSIARPYHQGHFPDFKPMADHRPC